MQSSETKDEYIASLEILNLTESVEVTLTVWNLYGEMKHVFVVNFVAPLPDPGGSVDVTVTQTGIPLWVIILVNKAEINNPVLTYVSFRPRMT